MMSLTIHRKAISRVTAHGLCVYPLEGYGLLLGSGDESKPQAILAALPVGKTDRWYEPAGRFSRVGEAITVATATFEQLGLRPVGLYCTVFSSSGDYPGSVVESAPLIPSISWLLLRFVDGGDSIFGCSAYRSTENGWKNEEYKLVSSRSTEPILNPRRLHISWNRAWGVLDYGNLNEIERPRLGLP